MKSLDIKKLYYSISDVSKIIDEEQYVLRYWETEFEQLRPQKNRAGNRIYGEKDLVVLRVIKYLLRSKRFTIDGAKEALRERSLQEIYADVYGSTHEESLPTVLPIFEQDQHTAEDSETPEQSLLAAPTFVLPTGNEHPHTAPRDRHRELLELERLRELHTILTRLLHRLAVITLVWLITMTSTASAQTAEEYYALIRKQCASAQTIRVRFATEPTDRSSTQLVMRGTMILKRDKKFRLEIGSRTIICNGSTLWNVANNTVVISSYTPNTSSMSPEMLFLDFPVDYAASLAREQDSRYGSTRLLTLTPKNAQNMVGGLERVLIRFKHTSPKDRVVIQSVEAQPQGTSALRIAIQDLQTNLTVQDSVFEFVPPKDMKVIDMR